MEPRTVEVSIIMPAYDVASFVEEAVASVKRQASGSFELIAVDDGSTDGTWHILKRLAGEWHSEGREFKLLRQPHRGAAAARNAGIAAARGTYIVFLDADDRWLPGLLAALSDLLAAEKNLDIAFPHARYIDNNGEMMGVAKRPYASPFDLKDLLLDNPILSATGTMVRRSAIEKVGMFDERLRGYIDYDYWLRVAALRPANIGCVPEILAEYRRRRGQITGNWRRMRHNWFRVFAKARRREPSLVPPLFAHALARQQVYWSDLAYAEAEYDAARRLMLAAWLRSPFRMVRRRHAWIRSAACLASYLPEGLHSSIARTFNAVRLRFGLYTVLIGCLAAGLVTDAHAQEPSGVATVVISSSGGEASDDTAAFLHLPDRLRRPSEAGDPLEEMARTIDFQAFPRCWSKR
jgi:glycosyltransferase involved in cell wall biosynthesis